MRRFYDAVAAGDGATVRECFHEDAVWILPGKSAIAGEHRGWNAIRDDFLAKIAPLSCGTFRVELLEVALGDSHVIAVQRATAQREGKRLDVTACQVILVEHGKIVHVRGHYSDQYALDDFWS